MVYDIIWTLWKDKWYNLWCDSYRKADNQWCAIIQVRKRRNNSQGVVPVDLCGFYLLILFIILVLSLLFANAIVWPSNKSLRLGARILDKTAWCLWQILPLLVIKLFLWMKVTITTRRNVHHAVTNFLPHHEWCTQLPSAAVMMLWDGGSLSVDGKSVGWNILLNCTVNTEEADA